MKSHLNLIGGKEGRWIEIKLPNDATDNDPNAEILQDSFTEFKKGGFERVEENKLDDYKDD
jgi:hypothetical protein